MRPVCRTQHPMEAQIVKGLLEEHGIRCVVQGEELQMARGMLGSMNPAILPTVWVNDEDVARAVEILQEHPPPDGVGERDAGIAMDADEEE